MKLKTQIVLTTHLVLIIASVLFGVFTYRAAKYILTEEVDEKLITAAIMAKEVLPPGYHDKITGPNSIDGETYRSIALKWTQLANEMGISYLWSLKQIDGKTVYTTVSRRTPVAKSPDYAPFFSEAEDFELFESAFRTMNPQFLFMNRYGSRFRVALNPFVDGSGSPCLFASAVNTSYLDDLFRKVVDSVAVICLVAMLVAMLIDFLLVRSISKPMEDLSPLAKVIKGGGWNGVLVPSGADEIKDLAENINTMSQSLHKTIQQCRDVEKTLRTSEHKYRFLTEHTSDVIWNLDENLRFDYISPSDERFRGFKQEEVLGTTVWDNVDPADLDVLKRESRKYADEIRNGTGKPSKTYELHLKRKDGDPVLAEVTVTAYCDDAGHIIGYHGTVHDIRERRRLEEERNKVERLQSVGTLAGGIAHDFNNILMGLFGNIELAKDLLPPDSHAHKLLDDAGCSMSRAVRLTKQLLVFSKGGNPQKDANVDLESLVREVSEFDLSGSNVKLNFTCVENLWTASVDKGQIEQVVSNIVINARQAMPDGGTVHVHLNNVELQDDEIGQLRAGQYVKVSIRDEGAGIPEDIQKRIFEPYFTTKQMGNGLGLATAYSIVAKHGGSLNVDSREGSGATFTFLLPVDKNGAVAKSTTPDVELLVKRELKRPWGGVLIMDDEALICSLIKKMLTLEGIEVETAANAKEATEAYRKSLERGKPFACVILDLTISGGVGGVETVRELRKLDPDVFAIASSGYADNMIMSDCRTYGFSAVIAKPYSRSEILKLLSAIGVNAKT